MAALEKPLPFADARFGLSLKAQHLFDHVDWVSVIDHYDNMLPHQTHRVCLLMDQGHDFIRSVIHVAGEGARLHFSKHP